MGYRDVRRGLRSVAPAAFRSVPLILKIGLYQLQSAATYRPLTG